MFLTSERILPPIFFLSSSLLTGEDDLKNMNKLLEMFDENDDVTNVWHNWENEGEE